MKFVVFLSCLLVVFAYATGQPEPAVDETGVEELVLDQEPEVHVDDDGHFVLRLVDSDGTTYEEEGIVLANEETGEEVVISKKGTFCTQGKDGKLTRLAYDIDSASVVDA